MNETDKALLKSIKTQAKELKAEGDAMMKKSHYADACERYIEATKLIAKQPSDAVRNKLKPWLPVLLGLEATCHLKTGAWKACVDVATRAMMAGKQNDPKLLYCRAQALENLGDLERAWCSSRTVFCEKIKIPWTVFRVRPESSVEISRAASNNAVNSPLVRDS